MGAFMRNAWAEFARDPEDGLANLGWPKYDPDGKSCARSDLLIFTPYYILQKWSSLLNRFKEN